MFSLKSIDGVALGFSTKSNKTNTPFRASMKVKMGKMNETNYYRLLSLDSEKASFEEIKKAYRSMALRYHPDLCPLSKKDESTRMFVELHRAYETLSNPTLRRKYDSELGMSVPERSFVQSGFSRENWEAQLHTLAKISKCREKKTSRFGRN